MAVDDINEAEDYHDWKDSHGEFPPELTSRNTSDTSPTRCGQHNSEICFARISADMRRKHWKFWPIIENLLTPHHSHVIDSPETKIISNMSGKRQAADPIEERNRFQIELEFVQCLANPNYLNFLAQRKYLQQPKFVAYLEYLQYWRQPEYAKYLRYPMCLYFLNLLQYEHFRKEISSSHAAKFIEDQQLLHWQHYIRKRSKMLNDAVASRQQRQTQP